MRLLRLYTPVFRDVNASFRSVPILPALVVIVHAQLEHPDLLKKFGGMFQKLRPHPQHDFRHYVALFCSTDFVTYINGVYSKNLEGT